MKSIEISHQSCSYTRDISAKRSNRSGSQSPLLVIPWSKKRFRRSFSKCGHAVTKCIKVSVSYSTQNLQRGELFSLSTLLLWYFNTFWPDRIHIIRWLSCCLSRPFMDFDSMGFGLGRKNSLSSQRVLLPFCPPCLFYMFSDYSFDLRRRKRYLCDRYFRE